ncbi:hypothetical protein Dsin_029258 [Dipteronia sinensis]|uniref:RRM domain-containing protein n=1 Tax=Dipteronia sinensis TaxID=43782 RepID=A0AAD9ZTE7_9ROSI|nr:hypothetical protein Dsin_029258 [Dipteronia sinensis]
MRGSSYANLDRKRDFRDNLHSVFVDNLNPKVDLVSLWGIFKSFGRVRDVYLSPNNGQRKMCFAFVRFDTMEEANKVATMVNDMHVYSWQITTKVATYDWNKRRTTSEIEREGFIRNRFFWDYVFYSMSRWSNSFIPQFRLAWLKVLGAPLSCWDEGFFKEVGGRVGETLVVEEATARRQRLDRGRILALVPREKSGSGTIKVEDPQAGNNENRGAADVTEMVYSSEKNISENRGKGQWVRKLEDQNFHKKGKRKDKNDGEEVKHFHIELIGDKVADDGCDKGCADKGKGSWVGRPKMKHMRIQNQNVKLIIDEKKGNRSRCISEGAYSSSSSDSE